MKELLKEPSTWRGLIMLTAGLVGITISTSQVDIIVNAAFILSGAIGSFVSDRE